MEIVVSIGAKIAEYTVAPMGRQLGYLFRYTTNVSELRTQLEHLDDEKDTLQHRVDQDRNNCQVIRPAVYRWLTSFDQVYERVDTFLNNHEDHAKAECSCRSLPHLLTRYQLSRKAKKMSIQVCTLTEKCKFDTISYPPDHLDSSSATTTKGYESFDSRRVILEDIMAAVGDPNRRRIGLHGMGGIGKTMLAKEIARQAKEEKLVSTVVITPISQAPNIKEIQQHIVEMLGMTTFSQNESIDKRAQLLRMRLKQDESKILLILDDIWKELDLEAIGIHDGSKILVTSRYRQVLLNSMCIPESNVFLIGALHTSEAINLFMKIIGDTEADDINDLAHEIVNECGGLPIAITTVAHALKYRKEEAIWKDALRRLKSSDVNDKVYSSIKLSYDFLGGHEKEAKPLLLLCALHKEDEEIQVEDLMRYSMGWRLLQGTYTVGEARNRVNSLVDTLKSHCLLLDGRSKITVKMHDVIRDVCIVIAKEDDEHRMMNNITSAAMYEEFVFHETHKASKAISFLGYDDFDNLPRKLEYPKLELLLLSSGSRLKSIPDDFFEQTGRLKVLAMSSITSFPLSFASLQNLQTLCLRKCSVEDTAVIGELKNLKALDLSESSSIRRLPKEIGELQRLQVLDLRKCYNLRVIEANVISNWTQMEELYLPREFEGWDKIIDEEGGIRNASLTELKSLQRLTTLMLYVPREHVLPQGMFTEKLERYKICIGVEYSSLSRDEVSSKWLGLSLSQLDQVYARELVSLMRRSECLSLAGSMSVNNGDPSLVNEGFPRLKHMEFYNNDGIQCIINSTHHETFPCLESLYLNELRSLESICHGGNKLPRGSFNQLREVEVRSCGRLKNLFPLSVAILLHEIKVQYCKMMEEIIVRGNGEEVGLNIDADDQSSSLQLRCLHLESLPKLVQFCCSNHTAPGESHHSNPLFSETVSFPKLEQLILDRMNTGKLWADQLMVSSSSSYSYMQNLTSLVVKRCNNLRYLFSFSLAQKFVNLKSIRVGYCEAMEDIIRAVDQPGEEETTHHDQMERIDLFPKLKYLELDDLSSLQRFCSATKSSLHVAFPLLSELTIRFCPEMKAFASCPTQVSSYHTDINQLLLSSQPFFAEKTSFLNLKVLTVTKCNNLKYLLSSVMARSLVQLERLDVIECENMEGVIASDEEYSSSSGGSIKAVITFEKLDRLDLDRLPNLIRFCEGDYCTECPLLSKLEIYGCPKLKEFMGDKRAWSSCTKNNNNKVSFPNLRELTSDWSEGIKEIFEMSSNSIVLFPNLDSLNLIYKSHDEPIGVPNLKLFLHKYHTIRTLRLMGSFVYISSGDDELTNNTVTTPSISSSLEELSIDGADMVDDVFGVEPSSSHNNTMVLLFPNLKQIKVKGCSRLQNFAPSFMSFPNLETLFVWRCHGLRYLLSSSTAATLVQLQRMVITDCDEMKAIINHNDNEKEEENKSTYDHHSLIIFQNLKKIELHNLPSLQSFFYSGDYCIECQLLSQLVIEGCPKLKELFMGDTRTSSSSSSSSCTTTTKSLFKYNNKVIVPMLKTLQSDWSEGIKEIFEMSSNSDSIILFPNLSNLDLTCKSPDEPMGVPNLTLFLHKYRTIQTLSLSGSFVNMSSDDELTTNNTTNATTTRLTSTPSTSSLEKLWITDADMLDYVFGVEPSSHSNTTILLLFPNLKEIEVRGCRRLQNFAPSFMCFPNLETLTIWGCHGLRYLLSSSTATTLVRLQRMEISDCDEMKEIIINHNRNEEEKDDNKSSTHDHHSLIVFQNLKQLKLLNLPSLQNFFYSGNKVIMNFPNLEELYITRCPKMRRFSDGIVNTSASLLNTIHVDVDYKSIPLEKDVNTTLAKLFREDHNKNNYTDLGL